MADIGFRRVNRFSGMIRSNPGLSRRILSKRLKELEGEGVIRRRKGKNGVVTWSLSPKGREMLPILMELLVFGSKWGNSYRYKGRPPRPREGANPED